jgi:hypothetical protein
VEGHDGALGESKEKEKEDQGSEGGRGFAGEDTAGDKIEGAGDVVGQEYGQELEGDRGPEQVTEILSPRVAGFGVLVVGDQGISGEGEDFIENVESKKVGGQSYSHRSKEGDSEESEKAGLGVFV